MRFSKFICQALATILPSITVLSLTVGLYGQNQAISAIQDRELLEVMIEDSTSELTRNEASLAEARTVYKGLGNDTAQDQELRTSIEEHIVYYEDIISSQGKYLAELRAQMRKLERQELEMLRNLQNFNSPYRDNRRTAFFDSILKPRNSNERFGESGKTRMEDLDAALFAAIGGLQGRLNQETQNRQEASNILLDREANVTTIVEMQKVSQGYYDERFVLYDKMNQTYEQILRWRPDLAIFFRPPPQPKPPEVYQRALERMQNRDKDPTSNDPQDINAK
jgi:hypothetical protein